MTEINTFSAAVDDAVIRSGRPDRKADIVAFVRASIREVRVLALFQKDFVEDQLLATSDPFIWVLPQGFRTMWTVSYPALVDQQGYPIYPRAKLPSRGLRGVEHYYYQSGDSMVFAGVAASANLSPTLTAPINIAYFEYGKKLPYYDLLTTGVVRPAVFTLETDAWTYNVVDGIDYDSTPELQQTARELVSNWPLFDWYDTVVEGTLAKILKVVGDTRAVSSFALFSSFKKDVQKGEAMFAVGGEVG